VSPSSPPPPQGEGEGEEEEPSAMAEGLLRAAQAAQPGMRRLSAPAPRSCKTWGRDIMIFDSPLGERRRSKIKVLTSRGWEVRETKASLREAPVFRLLCQNTGVMLDAAIWGFTPSKCTRDHGYRRLYPWSHQDELEFILVAGRTSVLPAYEGRCTGLRLK